MIPDYFHNNETFDERQRRINIKKLAIQQQKHKSTCLKNKLNRKKKRK